MRGVSLSWLRGVWNNGVTAVADRTVTVTTNNDKTGYTASSVGDKTGYSLTAGSYSPVKSVQRVNGTLTGSATTSNLGISSINEAKSLAFVERVVDASAGNGGLQVGARVVNATNVEINRSVGVAENLQVYVVVFEFY